jgi:hypothetical protein
LVGVTLDREAEYTAQFDALDPGWRNAADDLGRNRTATTLRSMIEDFLHLSRVPGQDDVGEQTQGIGHRLHLVGLLGVMTSDATRVDRALEQVDRFAPILSTRRSSRRNTSLRK